MDQPPGLRNTIYEHQTRSGRRLSRGRMMLYRMLVPIGAALLRLVWGCWARAVSTRGAEHIDAALARAPSFIPVYWHQHQLFCIRHLAALRARGLKLGFLISPSVDGELAAMLVQRLGGCAIRGSSTHTGARALRDYYQALVQDGISPVITPDGPKGPPWRFKPGAILLAQLSGRPMVPMSYAASRAWRIQWDRFVIPWPLARIAVAVGEPVYVGKGLDADALARLQADMEERLSKLFEEARALL
ncbi:MAG TPA: lysophospholipid acyltransferase family protein [Steroidobacteraceae bacterium]|nr:lysophospholipid acyltransferase family protein [Steroidobacteraceae bacterium]